MNINNRTLWSSLKVPGATVSVSRAPSPAFTVLKVASLIDTGRTHQTIVLENAFPGLEENDPILQEIARATSRNRMAIPPKIAHLNCVFTGRRPRLVLNPYKALQQEIATAKLMPVVAEVAAPGDYMLFKHLQNRACFKFSGVLRAVPKAALARKKA
ncbi:MAG: hypothetical protein ACPGRX_02525 [Bdellovibrionales bacterium]